MRHAYTTTLCNGDGYVPGVEALGKSLKASGTKAEMLLMVTPDVSQAARAKLGVEGWSLCEIQDLENPNPATRQLFPRFAHTFTKLRAWELTAFDKIVLLDADTLVLQNVDDLFERPELAAAPDFFLPDRFNSGVMVIEPSHETFARMAHALSAFSSYDGGDQGFLNNFFPGWYAMPVAHRLPAAYNMHSFIYQFSQGYPTLRGLLHEVKILHYTVQKPWRARATLSGGSAIWWQEYFRVHPEEASAIKQVIHRMEDWSFDQFIHLLVG